MTMSMVRVCRVHIGVTYASDTSTATIFINGTEVASCGSFTNTFTTLPEMTDALIGTGVALEEPYFSGKISNLFFYQKTLRLANLGGGRFN